MFSLKVRDLIMVVDMDQWIKLVDHDGEELFSGTKDELEVTDYLNESIESIWSEHDEYSSCITVLV
jgi:hypothetical protein